MAQEVASNESRSSKPASEEPTNLISVSIFLAWVNTVASGGNNEKNTSLERYIFQSKLNVKNSELLIQNVYIL